MRSDKTFIIAEAGVNHNGSVAIARKMIDAAKEAGADAVKFQTFRAENIVTRSASKCKYQKISTPKSESQFEMIKRLELTERAHRELRDHCRKKGIIFLSSPFDLDSVELLDRLGLEIFKIPSGELTNMPYLKKIGRLGKKVIISTGMANLTEVRRGISVLMGSGLRKKDITALHCVTEYPAPIEETNLRALVEMRRTLGVEVGYSDHTEGIETAIAAVALGAPVIEKHFTLDKRMRGPDHKASLEPREFRAMVHAIRNVERALGTGVKKPALSEIKNKAAVRKSIVASRCIRKGEMFTDDNLAAKRPGRGISPMMWAAVLGKRAKRNFSRDEAIKL